MIIDFETDGSVIALHNDKFPLSFLGKMDIRRASELIFNSVTQKWDIHVAVHVNAPDGSSGGASYYRVPEATGYNSYDEARRVEVAWFDAARFIGVDPRSDKGIMCLIGVNSTLATTKVLS